MHPDVIDVQPLSDYCLRLIFEGGEVRDFDMKPYLDFGIFAELRDLAYFTSVFIEFGSLEWPNGQGLSYDTLYLKSKSVNLEAAA